MTIFIYLWQRNVVTQFVKLFPINRTYCFTSMLTTLILPAYSLYSNKKRRVLTGLSHLIGNTWHNLRAYDLALGFGTRDLALGLG